MLYGWALKETSGVNSAELDIYDGQDTNGQLVVPITLQASQSTRDIMFPQGLHLEVGYFPNVASGTVSGAVWVHTRADW